jgi:hypothetical protein
MEQINLLKEIADSLDAIANAQMTIPSRQLMATQMMAALMANPEYTFESFDGMAKDAIAATDALLNELF